MQLKFGRYYVVEVSFQKSNPIHRAILTSYRSYRQLSTDPLLATADLFSAGYEGVQSVDLAELAYFRVLAEIPEMNVEKYPNQYKLPKEAKL